MFFEPLISAKVWVGSGVGEDEWSEPLFRVALDVFRDLPVDFLPPPPPQPDKASVALTVIATISVAL
jgi:hypothetical protein